MDCPFPGMDPYLEHPALWPGFHNTFLSNAQELLVAQIPRGYDVRTEQEVRLVSMPPEGPASFRPDFVVAQRPGGRGERFAGGPAGTALLEPNILPLDEPDWQEVREVRLVVTKLPGRELVTIFELLSPWNKTMEGMADFARKRRATVAGKAHWVEVDLLAGGLRTPLAAARPAGDYFAQAIRAERPQKTEVYSWGVRAPLPVVPIPLRAPDADLALPFAEVFRMTYRRARFGIPLGELPAGPPRAPLGEADLQWAAALAATRAAP